MPYPEYNGPDKPNKGQQHGACNRGKCQDEPANWYNHGSLSWYCDSCRKEIQFDHVNLRGWKQHFAKAGHPMFETQEMITVRENISREPATPPMDANLFMTRLAVIEDHYDPKEVIKAWTEGAWFEAFVMVWSYEDMDKHSIGNPMDAFVSYPGVK